MYRRIQRELEGSGLNFIPQRDEAVIDDLTERCEAVHRRMRGIPMNNNQTPADLVPMCEAQHLLLRIAKVYTSYLHSLAEGQKLDGITDDERDAMNIERVLCEQNYDRCCQLYDLNYAAFLETYGRYSERDNLDILLDILINGYPDEKTYQKK